MEGPTSGGLACYRGNIVIAFSVISSGISKDNMSLFLEILGCILCCEEDRDADSDDETSYPLLGSGSRFYNYLFRRNSATRIHNHIFQSDSTSRTITDEQDYGSSSLIISTRKASNPPPFPSNTTDQNSIVIGSRTSNSASTGYASSKSAERINQVSQNSKDLQSPAVHSSSSNLFPSVYKPATPFSKSHPPSPKPPSSSFKPSSSSVGSTPSFKPSSSSVGSTSSSTGYASIKSAERINQVSQNSKDLQSPAVPSSSSNLFPSVYKPATPFSKPHPSSPKPPSSSFKPSSSSVGSTPSSPKPVQSFKVTLSPASSGQTDKKNKMKYVSYEKDPLPIYIIPKDIADLIEKDIVPGVLYKPLSPSTYMDYFAALLYAEDHYIEKWSDFQLVNITVELKEASIYRKLNDKTHFRESDERKDTLFAAFEVDSIPERRPFLLSRDFVLAKPTGSKVDPFRGIIYRVVKSTTVLVEFEEDFYCQHRPNCKYDISFSFNRVCLKRAHQAVSAASDPSFQDYLFPDCAPRKKMSTSAPLLSSNYKLDWHQTCAVDHILSFQGPPPYLVEGPLCVSVSKELSKSGMVVKEAVIKIYKGLPQSRILICAPVNSTCDVLMRSLKKEIPEAHMFRANAAFRELDGVPIDILPSCLYKGECFSCPTLEKLRMYRVILSTFASSYRLRSEGINAGHFSHIFLVDGTLATEPETMVPLSNLANEKTAVIVTGAAKNHSGWVRSDIARKNGLMVSYFERLRAAKRYSNLDPMFITKL
ncbi:hypothetical protein ACOSQ4_026987 [Xanthoceras sorbifolium]